MDCTAVRGCSVGDPSRGPGPSCTSTAEGDKDGGVADGTSDHGKWDGIECAGMARFPLPEIWPRYPRPTFHRFIITSCIRHINEDSDRTEFIPQRIRMVR